MKNEPEQFHYIFETEKKFRGNKKWYAKLFL